MSDLEMLADLNHVELSHVEEALRRDVRCMVLREVCEYMKRSPENSLRIRRLYHRHDNLRAAQIAAQVVCNCRLSEEDLAWLDCCIRAAFHKKPRRIPISEEERRFLWNKQAGKSYSIAELRNEFPNSWEKIQKADEVNRKLYNEYIDRINSVLDEIYPQVMEKAQAKLDKLEANLDYYRKQLSEATDQKEIERMQRNVQLTRGEVNALRAQIESGDVLRNKRLIPRQNYYHHVQEISQGFSKLAQILSTPTDISTNLVGVSDFTKPKSRWAGFMQQR